MLRNHELPLALLLAALPTLAGCIEIVEGTDEIGATETGTGDETETGTSSETGTSTAASSDTDQDPDPDAETSTDAGTDTEDMGECQVSFEIGSSDQDCSFAITCTDEKARVVECSEDGCSCIESDIQIGGCSDSLGICGAHDVGAVQGCCGWQL